MNNWKVILATVVIFGAGVVMGGLLVNYVQHGSKKSSRHNVEANIEARAAAGTNQNFRQSENARPRPPEILCKQFLQRLNEPLHLTAKQREEIHKIISDGQNQVRKAVQDARLEIREVLTAEQRQQFDELIKRPFRKPLFSTNGPAVMPMTTNTPPPEDAN